MPRPAPPSPLGDRIGLDPRALGAFRIALAATLLADLAIRACDLRDHYTDAGVLPRADLRAHPEEYQLSLHMLGGSTGFEAALFAIAAVAALMLLAGVYTRASTAACWVLLVSLHNRHPGLQDGGDALGCCMLVSSLFVPLGERFSVDAVRRAAPRRRGTVQSVGAVGLSFLILSLYLCTAIYKVRGEGWVDGTALSIILAAPRWSRGLGHALHSYPRLLPGLTHAVLWLEMLGPVCLVSPVAVGPIRTAAVVAFLGLQAGIFLTIRLALFPVWASVAVLVFLPGWFWDRVEATRVVRVAGERARRWLDERGIAPARRRASWGGFAGGRTQSAGGASTGERIRETLAGGLLLLFLWMYVDGFLPALARPRPLVTFSYALGIEQHWIMFAHYDSGWLAIPGRLHDGTTIDLAQGDVPIDWRAARPPWWTGRRWWAQMGDVGLSSWRAGPFSEYLCRTWNAEHGGERRLEDVNLTALLIDDKPGGDPENPVHYPFGKVTCPP